MQQPRAQAEAPAETQIGMKLCARLQPFQDPYDRARAPPRRRLPGVCAGKHGRWGRSCALDDSNETSTEEPHWGRNSEGHPIAWVGSAPDDW
ncbi:hypothetical protein [Streptomyces sp. NBC_00690]|uniref:hypothetical protein n=1 Tax=Streptomyces sp. NBC_00690 TaxID=2975808 RepID=UPI002E27FD15|nr:hypothetical protein [Streptomyces sp. NBC_00690]